MPVAGMLVTSFYKGSRSSGSSDDSLLLCCIFGGRCYSPLHLLKTIPDLHQNLTEFVLSTSISTTAPIVIIGRILNERLISCGKQNGTDIGVGLKLPHDASQHHLVLHLFPIGTKRMGAPSTHLRRL